MMDYKVYVHIFPNGKKYVGITRQKVEKSSISAVCNGKRKTAGKMHWEFYKEMI